MATPGMGEWHRAVLADLPRTSAHIALAIDGFHDDAGGTVTLRPSGAPAIDYAFGPGLWRALRDGLRTLVRIDLASGAELVRSGHDPALEFRSERDLGQLDGAAFDVGRIAVFSAHVMGGCPMGDDPVAGIVQSQDLRHHSVENLHVIDGSVFPTSLGVNPQESIYGLSHLMTTRLIASWT